MASNVSDWRRSDTDPRNRPWIGRRVDLYRPRYLVAEPRGADGEIETVSRPGPSTEPAQVVEPAGAATVIGSIDAAGIGGRSDLLVCRRADGAVVAAARRRLEEVSGRLTLGLGGSPDAIVEVAYGPQHAAAAEAAERHGW